MDFLNLLARLAALDTDAPTAAAPRRAALSRLGQASSVLLPAVLAALPTASATAGTQETRLDALLLALQLEQLENEFYSRALGLRPGGPANPAAFFGTTEVRAAIQTIQTHEAQHVALFTRVLTDGGTAIPAAPNFDFTGSKNGAQPALYADVYTNLDTFLLVAQLLEDAGVRAYKGQAEFLQADNFLLEAALRTHSVEARHAAHIRTLRRQRGAVVKSWVSPSDAPITTVGTIPNAVYLGESDPTQVVVLNNVTTQVPFSSTLPINVGTPALSAAAILAKVAEAFDEPIDTATATALLQLFTYS